MDMHEPGDRPFECVEPALGDEMWRYLSPDCDEALRRRLEDHLTICDACRLDLAVARETAEGLRSGALRLDAAASAARPFPAASTRRALLGMPLRAAAWSGGLALAAAVLLALVLPPRPPADDLLRRGGVDAPHIIRPVEGEVVETSTPRLVWAPVPGATAYDVEISEVGGSFTWRGRVPGTEVVLPDDARLPHAGRYRVILEPVPADLAAPGDLSVSFRKGSLGDVLGYRLLSVPAWVGLLAAAGLLLLLGAGLVRLTPRRT